MPVQTRGQKAKQAAEAAKKKEEFEARLKAHNKTAKKVRAKPSETTGAKYKRKIYKDRTRTSKCRGVQPGSECAKLSECKFTRGTQRKYCRRSKNGTIFRKKKD